MTLRLDPTPAARGLAATAIVLAFGVSIAMSMHLGLPSSAVALPWLLVAMSGLVSGFLAGLLGIGGALVTIPVFYAVLPALGTTPEQLPAAVIGSALLTMVPTTIAASIRQSRLGALDGFWIRRLVPAMAVGALLGAALASHVRGPLLGWAFALQSLYYGGRLVLDRRDDGGASPRGLTRELCQLPPWLAGSGMAAFVAALGMGCGSVVAPFLRHRGVALRSAVATASALNLCIALAGSASFAIAALSRPGGSGLHAGAALLMGGAAVVAAPLGVSCAHRLPMPWFRSAIGAVNLVAAAVLVAQLIGR